MASTTPSNLGNLDLILDHVMLLLLLLDLNRNNNKSFLAVNTDAAVVLVTGGCGYVGTHTLVQLLERNVKVVVVDNLATLDPQSSGIVF